MLLLRLTRRDENGYWSPERKKDLVKALAAYENTELTPDQIQELKERDTPKEPEQFDGHWYKCPACGKYVGGLKGNFCHMCGQRLKQREEQE